MFKIRLPGGGCGSNYVDAGRGRFRLCRGLAEKGPRSYVCSDGVVIDYCFMFQRVYSGLPIVVKDQIARPSTFKGLLEKEKGAPHIRSQAGYWKAPVASGLMRGGLGPADCLPRFLVGSKCFKVNKYGEDNPLWLQTQEYIFAKGPGG